LRRPPASCPETPPWGEQFTQRRVVRADVLDVRVKNDYLRCPWPATCEHTPSWWWAANTRVFFVRGERCGWGPLLPTARSSGGDRSLDVWRSIASQVVDQDCPLQIRELHTNAHAFLPDLRLFWKDTKHLEVVEIEGDECSMLVPTLCVDLRARACHARDIRLWGTHIEEVADVLALVLHADDILLVDTELPAWAEFRRAPWNADEGPRRKLRSVRVGAWKMCMKDAKNLLDSVLVLLRSVAVEHHLCVFIHPKWRGDSMCDLVEAAVGTGATSLAFVLAHEARYAIDVVLHLKTLAESSTVPMRVDDLRFVFCSRRWATPRNFPRILHVAADRMVGTGSARRVRLELAPWGAQRPRLSAKHPYLWAHEDPTRGEQQLWKPDNFRRVPADTLTGHGACACFEHVAVEHIE